MYSLLSDIHYFERAMFQCDNSRLEGSRDLAESELDVSSARREVHNEVVQLAPI